MGSAWMVLLLLLIHTSPCDMTSSCTFSYREDGLHADCSRLQLTSLPRTWPDDVVWLDMSHNQVSVLTHLSHPGLAHLRHLDLSHNQLHHTLANHTFSLLGQLTWLSLRGNRLQRLQADALKELGKLTFLDLSMNQLQDSLANQIFSSLQQLQWLSLQDNRLKSLEVNAMTGLGQLTFLDLSNNQLRLNYDTYPPGVFHSLTPLQELKLHGNDDRWEGEYPEDIFQPLSDLRTLSIDTFSQSQFGPGFSVLTNINTLRLDHNCKLMSFGNTTLLGFQNSSLENLHVKCKEVTSLETCAFCHLPHLKVLYFNRATVSVNSALRSLYGLQHQTMNIIDFSDNQNFRDMIIDRDSAEYVRTICVSRINIANTNVQQALTDSIFDNGTPLVRCLQELDASRNRLWGAGPATVFMLFNRFQNLTSLHLGMQYVYARIEGGCEVYEGRIYRFGKDKTTLGSADFLFTLPPKMTYLNLSSAFHRAFIHPRSFQFKTPNTLKTFDISYLGVSSCHSPVFGLNSLERFDLSGNDCYNVSESFLDHCTALRHLGMSNLHISPEFFRTRAWRLFRNLELLQTLDLSLNILVHIDPHMLRAQRRLKELNLAGNRLQSLSVDLEPHKHLELLDVSHNMLPTLLPAERQALDSLAATHNFSLRLRGNPLLCACSNLDFVRWLWGTAVRLDGDGSGTSNYTCVTETGEVSDTHSVMAHFDTHWRRCVGQTMLGVASAAFLLQLLVLVIVYVVSRSWTHLRYVWKVMKRLQLPLREHFLWDAYAGYADADLEFACLTLPACLEERHSVRLLLRDREELPGSIRAESIVEHIDNSWKVLLFVTRAFAMDDWACGFTVQQAQRSITDTMPDRVIVIFMEDPARLPPMASLERLLRMVPESNVLHVKKETPPGHPVWDRVAEHILGKMQR